MLTTNKIARTLNVVCKRRYEHCIVYSYYILEFFFPKVDSRLYLKLII